MQDATVYVVDDIKSNRELIVSLMETVDLPTRAFASARDFLDGYDPAPPGCLLLDVRMPGMSGLELQSHLNEQGIRIPVIIVTAHSDVHIAIQAMKAGAFEFIEKPINNRQVLELVNEAIAESRRIIDEQNVERAIAERVACLTPREREVFVMILDGEPNKRIAHGLGISERTVEVHRSRVMEKMAAPSLANLVKMAIRIGLTG